MLLSPKLEATRPSTDVSSASNGLVVNQLLHFDVEARRTPHSTCPAPPIREAVTALIQSMERLSFVTEPELVLDDPSAWDPTQSQHIPFLRENVSRIVISDLNLHRAAPGEPVNVRKGDLDVHVFSLTETGPENELLEGGEEELAAANHYMLPSLEFDGLWESLVYDSNVKSELLNYASTALSFSEAGVDANIVACNRVVLLHGPPGTGKTSLCKALAQKLAIRFSHLYTSGQLVEINSHSLFSKWFSESGKLVMKMFQNIEEFVSVPDALVFLLIDEVESLTAARKSASNGNEPSDAIRVVNALLTQIDRLKRYPNVFILTTSNLTGSIDLAFVDRADIKQYIGPPARSAIAAIYESSIRELISKGLIVGVDSSLATRLHESLEAVSEASLGFSGRTLRKLPFIAFALFFPAAKRPNLDQFIAALSRAIQRQREERAHIPD